MAHDGIGKRNQRETARAGARPLSIDVRSTPGRISPLVPMLVRWLIPNQEQRRSRFPTPAYTRVQTLEKGPQNCHCVPLFGTFGSASWQDSSLGKALQHHEIGHDLCWAGPAENAVA
jgi:hypothetical protein